MKRYYFVGKTADEITRAPFLYRDETDAQDDLNSYSDAKGYRIFEITVKELVTNA